MEQYSSVISDFNHTAKMLSGFESLVVEVEEKTQLSPESRYVDSVMKLYDIDLETLAGSEGFLDSVKKGARKVYEWIKDLITKIRDFFFRGKRRKAADVVAADLGKSISKLNTLLVLEKAEEKAEGKASTLVNNFSDLDEEQTKKIQETIESQRRIREARARISVDEKGFISDAIKEVVNDEDIKEKVTITLDKTANRIYYTAESSIKQVLTNLKNIERVDPEGKSIAALGLKSAFNTGSEIKLVEKIMGDVDVANVDNITSLATRVVQARTKALNVLELATKGLEKANETVNDDPQNELKDILSRMMTIVGNLTDIANAYDIAVINMDSQLIRGLEAATDKVVKVAISKAKEKIGGGAHEALDRMMTLM